MEALVGIAQSVRTVRGSNPGGGEIFRTPSRPTLEPTQLPNTMGAGPFSGVKRPGNGVDHPPHLVPRLKKR